MELHDTKQTMVQLMVTIFLFILATGSSWAQSSDDVSWAKRVDTGSQVVTTMQFYVHDTLSGRNPSAVKVAQPQSSTNSLGGFGSLLMVDDPLTEGPNKNSKLIGHARGMYGQAAQNDIGLIMVLNYGFTDGVYKDSSFSLLSLNPAMQTVREMAIVGGTGLFRLARGYALARTYWIDPSTGDAIVGYNVTITTYI
ncbi:putative dirigent protein [Helianthus anomalus]